MKLHQVQSWILLCWLIRLERWHSKDTVCVWWWSWEQWRVKLLWLLYLFGASALLRLRFSKDNLWTCCVSSCWVKHNQLENMGDVEIILQSLVFLSTWLIFIFWQGSKFLIPQGSLASAAECVMLQNTPRESFERTIVIAKGNSSLGKFLFHIHLLS